MNEGEQKMYLDKVIETFNTVSKISQALAYLPREMMLLEISAFQKRHTMNLSWGDYSGGSD